MDPNATLDSIRDLVQTINASDGSILIVSDAFTLAELVDALDAWLKKGGFLPDDWQASRHQSVEP